VLLICSLTLAPLVPTLLDLATGLVRFLSSILPGRYTSLLEVLTVLIWRLLWGMPVLIAYFVGGLLIGRRSDDVRQPSMAGLWATLWYLLAEAPLTMVVNLIWAGIHHFSANMTFSFIAESMFSLGMVTRVLVDALIALTLGIWLCTLGTRLGRPHPRPSPRL
jgi:hypothetical protein